MRIAVRMGGNIMNVWFLSLVCLAIAVLAQAQDNPGFISIDCGALNGYLDENLTIQYSSDSGFIDSGQNMQISSKFTNQVPYQQLTNLRVFPNGTRNCYTIQPDQGKYNKCLIRASFYYGNFDGKSQAGLFDLYIDTNLWVTVSPSSYTFTEIIYIPSRDYIQVCLVNHGTGNPFISALELRLLDNSTYPTAFSVLVLTNRDNYGSTISDRYPHDVYDRIWQGVTADTLVLMTTNTTSVNFNSKNIYQVPTEVLMTAYQTTNRSYYLYASWPSNATVKWYAYFHFAELQVLQPGQVREFTVYVHGNTLATVTPEYLKPVTVATPSPASGSTMTYNISSTGDATLAPFLNAREMFNAIELPNPLTDLDDVDVVNAVKTAYGITRVSWQGDPCSPKEFIWSGLICSQDSSLRLTSLNLSSSGLTGKIATSLGNLAALVSLDLSFNQLTGQLPEFLAQMPDLKFLNLSGNSLNGPIPTVLKTKMLDGSLKITLDGNPLCQTDTCSPSSREGTDQVSKKKSSVVPIVVGVVVSVFVLVLLIIAFVVYKKRKNGKQGASLLNGGWPTWNTETSQSEYDTSTEVLSITENFKVTIGEDGFGNVSKVTRNFEQRSVKLNCVLSMALIYELMQQGNVREHLSEHSTNVLTWIQRLQIAVDAAQGLEYLHNGCRPPIIHRDLKTTNILLDEHMQAKIADFSLSGIFILNDHESYVSTRPAGTPGYLDPMFQTTGNLNKKSDSYSFGIILLELITGHPAVIRNPKGSTHIVQWVSSLIKEEIFKVSLIRGLTADSTQTLCGK